MRATTLLQTQHRDVDSIFTAIENRPEERPQLVKELADALAAHMVIEEELFYPEARTVRRDMVAENTEEHDAAAYMLRRLVATPVADERFMTRVEVLRDMITPHVSMEEAELFPVMDQAMTAQRNEALGQQMETRHIEAMKQGHEKALGARGMSAQPSMPAGQMPAGQMQGGQMPAGQMQQGPANQQGPSKQPRAGNQPKQAGASKKKSG